MKGYQDIEVSKLIKADWNYKEENETLTEKLLANIKKNGQVENLLIRELGSGSFEVVNGNHRLDVLKMLGIEKAHVYNFGKITTIQAKRIAIETNETKFESNDLKLADLVNQMTKEFDLNGLVNTLPYTKSQINDMSELTTFSWEEFDQGLPKEEREDKFENEIKVKVSQETYDSWIELNNKLDKVLGYKNESKVLEFAIIEALNIPLESLQ